MTLQKHLCSTRRTAYPLRLSPEARAATQNGFDSGWVPWRRVRWLQLSEPVNRSHAPTKVAWLTRSSACTIPASGKPKPPNKESLKWGHMNEDKARQHYAVISAPSHQGLSITETGLMVHPEHGMVRASPDGIVKCQCHPLRLLEIKCPYGARDMDIESAVQCKKIMYLKEQDGLWELKETSEGYYTQVQTTMAVCGLTSCDFVVFTKKDIVVIHVPFDPLYWNNILHSALCFYEEYVIPSLNGVPSARPFPSTPESLDLLSSVDPSPEQPQTPLASLSPLPEKTATTPFSTPGVISTPSTTSRPMPASESATPHSRPIATPTPGRPKRSLLTRQQRQLRVAPRCLLPPPSPVKSDLVLCGRCRKPLPDDVVDNSDASVGCDCSSCKSEVCAGYDLDQANEHVDWFCPKCGRSCDNIM